MNRTHDEIIADIRSRHEGAGDVCVKSLSLKMEPDADDSHKFTARITTATLDRDGEVLLSGGMDATEFNKSGAIFWNHQYNEPVGIAKKIRQGEGEAIAHAEFMRRPADYEGDFFPDFARAFVSQMVKAGKAPGVSVGLVPVEARRPTSKDRSDYGEGVKRVVTRWKLLEWSIAPVQANPEAVVTAVGKAIGAAGCKALGLPEPLEVEEPEPEKTPDPVVVVGVPEPKAAPRPMIVVCVPGPRPESGRVGRAVEKEVSRRIARKTGQLWI